MTKEPENNHISAALYELSQCIT